MKKVGNLILVICSLFLLSGCMKHNVSMTINKDKSMDLEIIYAINIDKIKSMMDSFGNTNDNDTIDEDTLDDINDDEIIEDEENDIDMSDVNTEEEKSALEKRGYKVIEYNNDGYEGLKATLKIDNIDNVSVEDELKVKLSDILAEDFDDDKFFTVEKGFFKNTYTANFIYEINDNTSSSAPINLSNLDIKYTVLLPSKSISNNADTVRDNELTWIISLDKTTNVEYSFEMLNMTNIYIVGGIGTLLIVIIIVIIILVQKKKHKKNTTNDQGQEQSVIADTQVTNIESNYDINLNVESPIQSMDDSNDANQYITTTDFNSEQLNTNNTINMISSEDVITDTMMLDTNDIQNNVNKEEKNIDIKTCPQCGVEVTETQRFCENCGKQLN